MNRIDFILGTLPRTLLIEHIVTLRILNLWLCQAYTFVITSKIIFSELFLALEFNSPASIFHL